MLNLVQITFEIEHCRECPKCKINPETGFDYYCVLLDRNVAIMSAPPTEEQPVPGDCPLLVR